MNQNSAKLNLYLAKKYLAEHFKDNLFKILSYFYIFTSFVFVLNLFILHKGNYVHRIFNYNLILLIITLSSLCFLMIPNYVQEDKSIYIITVNILVLMANTILFIEYYKKILQKKEEETSRQLKPNLKGYLISIILLQIISVFLVLYVSM